MKIGDLLQQISDEVEDIDILLDDESEDDQTTMVSPLQQKHEMLKKVSGLNNNTDKFNNALDDSIDEDDEDNEDDENGDSIDSKDLRQLAGISPKIGKKMATAAIHFVADDHESD